MLYELFDKINVVAQPFYIVLYMSVLGSIVGIGVYCVRCVFDNRMSGKSRCLMWVVVFAVLLIPARLEIKTDIPVSQGVIAESVENIKKIPNGNFIA